MSINLSRSSLREALATKQTSFNINRSLWSNLATHMICTDFLLDCFVIFDSSQWRRWKFITDVIVSNVSHSTEFTIQVRALWMQIKQLYQIIFSLWAHFIIEFQKNFLLYKCRWVNGALCIAKSWPYHFIKSYNEREYLCDCKSKGGCR